MLLADLRLMERDLPKPGLSFCVLSLQELSQVSHCGQSEQQPLEGKKLNAKNSLLTDVTSTKVVARLLRRGDTPTILTWWPSRDSLQGTCEFSQYCFNVRFICSILKYSSSCGSHSWLVKSIKLLLPNSFPSNAFSFTIEFHNTTFEKPFLPLWSIRD